MGAILQRPGPGHANLRWDNTNKRLLTTATSTFPPGTAGMREDKLGTDLYWYLVYDQDGYLPYSFDSSGFFAASGHNVGGVVVMQNVADVPANAMTLGHAAWKGGNSIGNYHTYAYILCTADDVNSASMDSTLTFGVMSGVNDPNNGSFLQPNVFFTVSGSALTIPSGRTLESASGTLLSLGNLAVRGSIIQGLPAASIGDVNLPNGSFFPYMSGNNLIIRIRMADGSLRTFTGATV